MKIQFSILIVAAITSSLVIGLPSLSSTMAQAQVQAKK